MLLSNFRETSWLITLFVIKEQFVRIFQTVYDDIRSKISYSTIKKKRFIIEQKQNFEMKK